MPELLERHRKVWIAVIVVVLVIGAIGGAIGTDIIRKRETQPETKPQINGTSVSPLSEAVHSSDVTLAPVSQIRWKSPLSEKSKTEITRCFPRAGERFFFTLSETLGKLVSVKVMVTNTHLKNEQEKERRIQLLGEPDEKGLRLRLFGVDQEGLPVPIRLPREQAAQPSDEFLKSIFKFGVTTFTQEKSEETFEKGTAALTLENGLTTELHIHSGAISLGCAETEDEAIHLTECQCISN